MGKKTWYRFSDRVCFQLTACQQVITGQSSTSDDGTASSYISLRWEPFLTSECLQMPMMLCSRRNRQSTDVTGFFSWREEGSLAYKFNTEHQTDMSEIKEVLEDALRVSKR